MKTDGIRGMTMVYNRLNLPQTVSKGSDVLAYGYSADGSKREKKYNNTITQQYRGSIVYDGSGAPEYVVTPEGMVRNTSGSWVRQYNLTDHLGNTRAVLDPNAGVSQQTDYYPFGTAFTIANTNKNKHLYGGKEYQDEVVGGTPLELYDFGARFYDSRRGDWPTRDPLTEKYYGLSPYVYCANNPINVIDYDGRDILVLQDSRGAKGMGHHALLIGSDNTYWTYISKDGYAGSSILGSTSKYVVKEFSTLDAFANSPHNFRVDGQDTHSTIDGTESDVFLFEKDENGSKVERYDNVLRIETTQEDGTSTDSKAIEAAIGVAKTDYILSVSDCSHVVSAALNVSKNSEGKQVMNGEHRLFRGKDMISRLNGIPKLKFERIESRNPNVKREDKLLEAR